MSTPNRPDPSQRIIRDRTEPVTITIRTRWLYTNPGCVCCPGPHAFSRSGKVVASDVPARSQEVDNSIADNIHRAIAAFGDDADLIIEVRRADPQP